MQKMYKRINWNTGTCNGNIDVNKYLYSQLARAICDAVYEKPLTVEEISIKTGLPTIYIEDELPRLIYGDAIVQAGNKYATNFIILRLCDKKIMLDKFAPLVNKIADYFAHSFSGNNTHVAKMDFYGADFGINRLGYIALAAVIRDKTEDIMKKLDMKSSPYPPRLDGGYGWFIVDEKEAEHESLSATDSGCNSSGDADKDGFIYYYWIGKYYQHHIGSNTAWLANKNIVGKFDYGIVPADALSEDDLVRLLQSNLIIKDEEHYKLNFAAFTHEQFYAFRTLFSGNSHVLDALLSELISDIHMSFKTFVPKRLNDQINQYVCSYVHNIIGFVAETLISRGILEKPDAAKPLVNGVFYLHGNYINI